MVEDSEFRIEKREVPALVRTHKHTALEGLFMCSAISAEHTGRERLTDLLNDPEPFVPFFETKRQGATLINKDHIFVVELKGPDLAHDDQLSNPMGEMHLIELTLGTGGTFEGQCLVTGAAGHTRTLDYLNRTQHRFIYVDAPEGYRILNLNHVISVRDLGKR